MCRLFELDGFAWLWRTGINGIMKVAVMSAWLAKDQLFILPNTICGG
jgi:hypothetical protein